MNSQQKEFDFVYLAKFVRIPFFDLISEGIKKFQQKQEEGKEGGNKRLDEGREGKKKGRKELRM